MSCPPSPFPERPLPQGTERKRGLMRGMEQMLIDQETKKKNQTVGAAFYAMQAAHAARDKWGAFPGDGRTSLATPDCACPQCTPPLCWRCSIELAACVAPASDHCVPSGMDAWSGRGGQRKLAVCLTCERAWTRAHALGWGGGRVRNAAQVTTRRSRPSPSFCAPRTNATPRSSTPSSLNLWAAKVRSCVQSSVQGDQRPCQSVTTTALRPSHRAVSCLLPCHRAVARADPPARHRQASISSVSLVPFLGA